MGIQLNIKSAEARALAQQVAEATGVSITEAITQALRQRVAQLQDVEAATDEAARARHLQFGKLVEGSRALWKPELLSPEHGDLLYDERGLPR